MKSFWQSRSVRILSAVLILQAALFYGFSRAEKIPAHKPLASFAIPDSDWRMSQELEVDKESLAVLKADDILSRAYVDDKTGQVATLFVAYFSTQRTGKAPHSPKNCLPGSGWMSTQSGTLAIPIKGEAEPVRVNKYVIARGDNESVVLYWYQARNRVVASEYTAKIFTVTDSIRYNRSDTSLVRVVVGVNNGDRQAAVDTAISFVQAFFEPLREYLPA
ncbi:MAG TPA: EpsI family protein [Bryobacteraceae bacterium]|jgi:EpsI family protein